MSTYQQLAGQDVLVRILRRAMRRGQMAHALLFHGENGQGMELAAWALARALLCQEGGEEACERCPSCAKTARLDHPDLELVLPLPTLGAAADSGEGTDQALGDFATQVRQALGSWMEKPHFSPHVDKARQIQVAQVRALKKWALMRSFEGGRRVAILFDAGRMGIQAQNALLKLLEEPPDGLVLLLCTHQPEALLPTILSRCQQLHLRPVQLELLAAWVAGQGLDESCGMDAHELAQLSSGNPGRAVELADELKSGEQDTLWRPEAFIRDILARESDALYQRIVSMEESRDRERVKRFLEDLQIWLMDAELVRLLGAEAAPRVVNRQQLTKLETFSSRWHYPRLDLLLESLGTASRRLDRNVNTFLLLTTLAQAMRRAAEPIARKQPA
jgi:DNA polymerase-3 subunit delta'